MTAWALAAGGGALAHDDSSHSANSQKQGRAVAEKLAEWQGAADDRGLSSRHIQRMDELLSRAYRLDGRSWKAGCPQASFCGN